MTEIKACVLTFSFIYLLFRSFRSFRWFRFARFSGFVSVVSVVSVVSFRSFRSFRWSRFVVLGFSTCLSVSLAVLNLSSRRRRLACFLSQQFNYKLLLRKSLNQEKQTSEVFLPARDSF